MTRKVLLIYPESDSPHALRILRPLIKFLPDHGWTPLLLTEEGRDHPFEVVTCKVPSLSWARGGVGSGSSTPDAPSRSKGVRSAVGRALAIPDRYNLWALRARPYARRMGRFDAVISSGPPHSAHLVAAAMKSRGDIRWIADMRDPWSTNAYTRYTTFTLSVDRFLERRVLHGADEIVTVSAPLAESLSRLHGRTARSIPNPFDLDEFPAFSEPRFDPLVISYCGSLTGGRRDPGIFMRGARLFHENRPEIHLELRFFTDDPQLVSEAARQAGVTGFVHNEGWADRATVLEEWRRASVLLLLRWDHPYDAGIYTGKLFEYLGAARPVLSTGGAGGIVADLLEEVGGGRHCHTPQEVCGFLYDLHSSGWIAPLREKLARFESRSMTQDFVALLDG